MARPFLPARSLFSWLLSLSRCALPLALAIVGAVAVGASPALAASAPAKPAAAPAANTPTSALVPYAAWTSSLSAKKEQMYTEQAHLVFVAGRLGAWDTVQSFLRFDNVSGAQRAAMYLAATRAARFNKDWPRAKELLGKLRDSLASIPKTERSFALLAGFCTETSALREAEGLNERFEEAAGKIEEGESPEERFARLEALAMVTVYAHDEKTFSDIGSAIVQFARQWAQADPGFASTPAPASVAMRNMVDELIAAGEYGVAAQIAQGAIADEGMLAESMFRAQSAGLASATDDKIDEQLASLSAHHERLAVTLGTVDNSGAVFFAARHGRDDLVRRLLVRARDLGFTPQNYDPNDGVARTRDQLPALAFLRTHWGKALQAAAAEYVRAGVPEKAAALGALFTETRVVIPPAQRSDLPDLLADQVSFAAYLAEVGQTTEARRLLDALPVDYATVGAANSEYARMDLAVAHALLGDLSAAQTIADTLKNAALRVQTFSAIVVAAQMKGETSRATTAFSVAAKAFADSDTHVTSTEGLAAYMAALAVTGSSSMSWKMLGDPAAAQGHDVLTAALTRLIAGGHWLETAGWITSAPDEWKSEAWHRYFQIAAPNPAVTPFAPGEMVAPPGALSGTPESSGAPASSSTSTPAAAPAEGATGAKNASAPAATNPAAPAETPPPASGAAAAKP